MNWRFEPKDLSLHFRESQSSHKYRQKDHSPKTSPFANSFCQGIRVLNTSDTDAKKWATKKNRYFPLYWLCNRDPYNGLL